jgi:hypothetical protein
MTHNVDEQTDSSLECGLNCGESDCIWLANEMETDLFVTDGFNTTNYPFVTLTLEDRDILFIHTAYPLYARKPRRVAR